MQRAYWIKFLVISFVVVGATVATVVIRGKMHEIMYIQNKIVHMQEATTDIGTMMGDMNDMSMSMDTDNMDMSMGMDTDNMDMSMGDDMSIDTSKKEMNSEKITEKVKLEKEKYEANKSLPETQDELEHLVSTLKGQLAQLFIVINLFVITAGIFLAYEVHTSSIAYEALESMIGRLKHRRKKLLKMKNDAENALSKNEKDELLQVLKKYVETVNTFDENSQLVKSLRVSIENIYIEMVYYMLGAMEEQNLLTEFDLEYMEQFSPEYLSERFKQEWKLENIDIISEEVMHINNIDKFIEEFQCDKLKKKDIKDV